MEELMKNLYLFLTEAERGDVLRIHVTETDECYEFSYDEVMDIVFHNRIPERFKKEGVFNFCGGQTIALNIWGSWKQHL